MSFSSPSTRLSLIKSQWMLRMSVSWDRFGTLGLYCLKLWELFYQTQSAHKNWIWWDQVDIGFQWYCYFEYRLIKCKSDGVLIVFTGWFYNRLLFDLWIKITIIPYTWRTWYICKISSWIAANRISWLSYPTFTLNQVKRMLIILFKPIAYSWLLSKTIGLVNLVIKFPGILFPLFSTE